MLWWYREVRFAGDAYAQQLLDELELQFAALDEHVRALDRTFIILTAEEP